MLSLFQNSKVAITKEKKKVFISGGFGCTQSLTSEHFQEAAEACAWCRVGRAET